MKQSLMKRFIPALSAAIMLLLLQNAAFAQAKPKDALDGKAFTVEITEEKDGKPVSKTYSDEFFFKSGKFKAKIAVDNGFSSNTYDVTVDSTSSPAVIEFTIESKNAETQERFSCEGTVKGNFIEGTAYYIKKGKTKNTYKFAGDLKTKKAPVKKPAPTKPSTTGTNSDTTKTE
jgi:hypothetical protein